MTRPVHQPLSMDGVALEHLPHCGDAAARPDLPAGRVVLMFAHRPAAVAKIRGGGWKGWARRPLPARPPCRAGADGEHRGEVKLHLRARGRGRW